MVTNIKVTPTMIEAGEAIASELIKASCNKSMDGLGGGLTWQEWLDKDVKNKDLIIAYVEKDMSSVEAIYLAMGRALHDHINCSANLSDVSLSLDRIESKVEKVIMNQYLLLAR
jgi:hypothetical protein